MQAQVIQAGNLRFGSARYDHDVIEPGSLPSLYFVANDGKFRRVRPYHDSGFAIVSSDERHIFFITDDQYEHLKGIGEDDTHTKAQNQVAYLEGTCAGDKYAPGADVSGKTGRRIADYRPGYRVHRGHQLITVDTAREIYASHGIDLDRFVTYVANNPGVLTGTEKDVVITRIKEVLA